MFQGIVNIAAIDASSDGPGSAGGPPNLKRIAQEYNVNGFPTMKLFYTDLKGKQVIDVNSRDPNELIKVIMTTLQNVVQERADVAAQPRKTFKDDTGSSGNTGNTGSKTGSSKKRAPKGKHPKSSN